MSKIQKILIVFLAVILLVFSILLIGVNSYNTIAKADGEVTQDWGEFEKVYQPRFEIIQRIIALMNNLAPNEPLNSQIEQKRLAYAQARTIDSRVDSLIEMEITVRQLIVFITSQSSLANNMELTKFLGSLNKTEILIVPKFIEYNQKAVSYNKLVRRPIFNIISSYFHFDFKPVLPLLWQIESQK